MSVILSAGISAFLFFGVAGLLFVLSARSVQNVMHPADAHGLAPQLRLLGWTTFAVYVAGIVVIQIYLYQQVLNRELFIEDAVIGAVLLSLFPLTFGMVSLVLLRIGAALSRGELPHNYPRLSRWAGGVSFAGWAQMLLAGVFLFGLGVLAAPIITLLVLGALGTRHRGRQATLLWLLAITVEKGMPIADEIDAFADTVYGRYRQRLKTLADLLRGGMSLPEALDGLPGLVPSWAVLVMHTGMKNARLTEALREAAVLYAGQERERTNETYSFGGFMLYLFAVMTFGLSITGFLMYWIVPKFKAIFEGFGTELPGTTVLLIESSNLFVNYWFLFFPLVVPFMGVMVIVNIAYYWGWDHPFLRRIQAWFVRFDTPSILRNLGHIITAKRPIAEGLNGMTAVYQQPRIRDRLSLVLDDVKQGGDCWTALESAGFLRQREWALLKAAERVGNLPWALRYLSESITRRQVTRLLALAELIQPIVVLFLGGIVFFIIVAMFMPLIKLLNDLS